MKVSVLICFPNRYHKHRAKISLAPLYPKLSQSSLKTIYSYFQMQQETAIQGPKEHLLLPYLVLPSLSGWMSSPCLGRLGYRSKPISWI